MVKGASNFHVFHMLSEGLWLENFAVRKARASPKINSFLLWGRTVVGGWWVVGGGGLSHFLIYEKIPREFPFYFSF